MENSLGSGSWKDNSIWEVLLWSQIQLCETHNAMQQWVKNQTKTENERVSAEEFVWWYIFFFVRYIFFFVRYIFFFVRNIFFFVRNIFSLSEMFENVWKCLTNANGWLCLFSVCIPPRLVLVNASSKQIYCQEFA